MKKFSWIVILLGLAGCALSEPKPANRDEINREMPLIVNYEAKRNTMKQAIGMLAVNGVLDPETGRKVKEAMDIEYVYYEASIISLARGEMRDYRAYVALAEKELERTKSALATRIKILDTH